MELINYHNHLSTDNNSLIVTCTFVFEKEINLIYITCEFE